MRRSVPFLVLLLFLPACGSQRPILYPNQQYRQAGPAGVEQDIEQCSQMANDAGAGTGRGKTGQVAGGTVAGGAIGSAAGAVGGAIVGRPGRGAMIGAASGATGGFLRGLFRKSSFSDAYKQFVNRCLRERGYDPVGWE
jgi:Glycine-zipper domain